MPVSIFAGWRISEKGERETIELGASLAPIKSMDLTKDHVSIKVQGKESGACSCIG